LKLNIHGSKMEVTSAIKNYLEDKLKRLDKYFEQSEDITANIVIRTRGIDQTVEVTIPIKRATLRAEESSKDLYTSIDLVADKLEGQIRKSKKRIKQKANKDKYNMFIDFEVSEDEIENESIVKRKTVDMKPMCEEEAILQMNLLGHEFFVFQNSDTGRCAVIYKRKDKNYGIIEMK